MPYIEKQARERLDRGDSPKTAGELNYAITRLVDDYLIQLGGIRYAHLNEAVGALECAKLELYRRLAAPYEDRKKQESGDVYLSPQHS
jgi:predicted negative regulator of RcsB-dependent stress response